MSYQTIIPAGKVKEEDLIAIVDQVKAVTKKEIAIEYQMIVVTDDKNVSSMLDNLMNAIPADQPAVKKNGKAKATKKAHGNGAMTSHQVRIDDTQEILSKQAFNKRLAAGEVAELTNVTNAKGQKFVVIDRQLAKAPQS